MSVVKQTNKNPGNTTNKKPKYKRIRRPQPVKAKPTYTTIQTQYTKKKLPKPLTETQIRKQTIHQKVKTKKAERKIIKAEIRARDPRNNMAFGKMTAKPRRTRMEYWNQAKDIFINRFFQRLKEFFGNEWEDEWTIEAKNIMMLLDADELNYVMEKQNWTHLYYESRDTRMGVLTDEAEVIFGALMSELNKFGG